MSDMFDRLQKPFLTVETGEVYYLIVDRPHGFGNFSMEWFGTQKAPGC